MYRIGEDLDSPLIYWVSVYDIRSTVSIAVAGMHDHAQSNASQSGAMASIELTTDSRYIFWPILEQFLLSDSGMQSRDGTSNRFRLRSYMEP